MPVEDDRRGDTSQHQSGRHRDFPPLMENPQKERHVKPIRFLR
jgi:hypothetical protein